MRTYRRSRRWAGHLFIPVTLFLIGPTLCSPSLGGQGREAAQASVAELEAALAASPGDARLMGRLGMALAIADAGIERDFQQRVRARRLLEDAFRAEPENPKHLLGLALVYERAGMLTDVGRLAQRGLALWQRDSLSLTTEEVARLYRVAATARQTHVEEFEHLRAPASDGMVLGVDCWEVGSAFCLNWSHPERFLEHFMRSAEYEAAVFGERASMRAEFRAALARVPDDAEANRGLLRSLARSDEWGEYAAAAESWVASAKSDPWASVFLAAGLAMRGDLDRADALFEEALTGLPPADAAPFLDIGLILSAESRGAYVASHPATRKAGEDAHWRRNDPLYLTAVNERRLEHRKRVAFAHLWLDEPATGLAGVATDRGQILIRYGLPEVWWLTPRDESLVVDAANLGDFGTSGATSGGRWIFWNYGEDLPSFIFAKELGRSEVEHMRASESKSMAENAAKNRPSIAKLAFAPLGSMRYQMARFLGIDDRQQVEVHGTLVAEPGVSDEQEPFEAALFLHREAEQVKAGSTGAHVRDGAFDLTVREMRRGSYRFSLEVATADRTHAQVERGDLDFTLARSGLRMSDLLLAHGVTPRRASPAIRDHLLVKPLRCLELPEDGRVWVVFEAYGVVVDAENVHHYRVDIETSLPPGDAVVRFFRGLARRVGRGEPGRGLSFERDVPYNGRAALEWFELSLPPVGREGVRLQVAVTDRATGESTSASRVLGAGGCG